MKKIIFLVFFAVVSWQHALSQNFTYGGLNFTVTGSTTVKVGSNGGITGAVSIPSNVTYNSSTYSVTSISDYAFINNTALNSVTIPDSVTSISDYAFYGCSGLTSVIIGNSVTSIGTRVFDSCSVLTSITIPNSVTSIEGRAFYGCSGLTSVIIGNSVTTIGNSAFEGCSVLASVTIPNSVTSIGFGTFFNCIGLTSVIIGNSVTSIGESAFNNCTSLTSVTIPNSVSTIGAYSFLRCTSLTSLTIGNLVTSIGDFAFDSCSALTSVAIPNSVTNIGGRAFAYCTGLTSLIIGNSVTSIGSRAFLFCSALTSVQSDITTPLSIDSEVFLFANQSACTLIVPAGSVATYQAAAVWQDFAQITCASPTFNTTIITACDSYNWSNTGQTYIASGVYTGTTANCVTEELNLIITQSTLWTGALSTAWNTPGNWSSGSVPTSISDVTIAAVANQPVLSANVSIHTLTLEAGTTMTVPTGLNLKVSNYIHNSGTLTVENNANLIQVDDVVNTGNIIVYRDSAPMVRLDHTMWSSPVASQNLFTFSPATLTTRFYTYDTSSNAYTNLGLNASSTFEAGKGFAVRAPNNQTAVTPTAWQGTFTGVPNNGTIPFTLNTTTPGYNLVGNPYPSTIDADAFLAANPNIMGTFYFYAHSLSMDANGVFPSGTNYATWNSLGSTAATRVDGDVHLVPVSPSGIIQVGQGFIVKAISPGTINFTNTMRVADNGNQNFRTKTIEKDRLWLNLKTETGTDINQILVGYITGATQGVDRNYDGLSFGNTGSYLSSKIAGGDYAIQGRSGPFDSSDEIALGFKAATAGNYTIALTNSDGLFAGNQEVFLKDNLTGITHNIKGSAYRFNSQAGTFDARFSLVYAKTLGVDASSLSRNSVQVYKEYEWFRVKTNGITMQEVCVYDLAGQLILKQSGINDTTTLLKGLSQVNEAMLVKISSQENQTVTIKVIK